MDIDALRREMRNKVRRLQRRLRQLEDAEAKYAHLLEKYEHMAADRAMWLERAHGRDPEWPMMMR